MKSLNMGREYQLTSDEINRRIGEEKIGNYALGYVKQDERKSFIVCYVGRSDTDLKRRIKNHIGENPKYQYFKFSYATSAKDAYYKECNNWHDFGGPEGLLNNSIHPDKPEGANWKCPQCGE